MIWLHPGMPGIFGDEMKETIVHIASVVEGGICVAAPDGHRVHDKIKSEIAQGNRVALSFRGVTRLTTAFLNAAVGQLYGEFSEEHLRRQIAPAVEAESWHLKRLKDVVDRAKIFFANPNATTTAFRRITGLQDE